MSFVVFIASPCPPFGSAISGCGEGCSSFLIVDVDVERLKPLFKGARCVSLSSVRYQPCCQYTLESLLFVKFQDIVIVLCKGESSMYYVLGRDVDVGVLFQQNTHSIEYWI